MSIKLNAFKRCLLATDKSFPVETMTQKDYKLELLAAIESSKDKDPLTVTREFMAQKALDDLYEKNADAMKRLADLEAWETYCEASLDLSNQDDVGKDTEEEDEDYKHFEDCLQKIKNITHEKLVELMGEEWLEDYRQRFP